VYSPITSSELVKEDDEKGMNSQKADREQWSMDLLPELKSRNISYPQARPNRFQNCYGPMTAKYLPFFPV
jgi:hypothetical protein